MQTMTQQMRGLRILLDLNLDRFLFVGALGAALILGAYIGSP